MSKHPYRPSLPTIPSSYYGDNQQTHGLKERFAELLGSSEQLPMYKDKPDYPAGRRKAASPVQKLGAILAIIFLFAWFSGLIPGIGSKPGWKNEDYKWAVRKEAVRQAFIKSWDDYAEHAWGMDEYHPIKQTGKNMGCARQSSSCAPAGWIIVDALDTAMMMNLTSRVAQAREWISTSLDFGKIDSEMSTFETTIRVLGGLLSAHWLSTTFPDLAPLLDDDQGAKGEDLYIEKATDLADRLLGAYDTPTGIPLSSCILNTSTGVGSHGDAGAASTAEAATLQLEMKYVSKITGEPLYWERAEKVIEAIDAPGVQGGLVPIFVDPQNGHFRGHNIRLGSRGDSYYEYLIKQYLQTGSRESVYLEMWEETLQGMKDHLVTWSTNADLTVLAERPSGLNEPLTAKMDHLVCFLPGTIALGVTKGKTVAQAKAAMGSSWGKKQEEDMALAEELMKTCWGMYLVTPTGLAPEISYFNLDEPPRSWNSSDPNWRMPRSQPLNDKQTPYWREDYDIHVGDVHNLQRPETVESLFYMWRITGNVQYREWGWQIFEAFMKNTAVTDDAGDVVAYSSIGNVNSEQQTFVSGVAGNRIVVGGSYPRDNMEGFWMAETLKYLYLLFEDQVSDWNNLEKVVINTEAHFLPVFDIGTSGKVWKTGWSRKDKKHN